MIPKTATSRLFSVSRTFTTTAPRSTTATCVESRPILCRRNRARGAGSCCPYPGAAAVARPPTSAATPASRSHGLCCMMDYPVRTGRRYRSPQASARLTARLSPLPRGTDPNLLPRRAVYRCGMTPDPNDVVQRISVADARAQVDAGRGVLVDARDRRLYDNARAVVARYAPTRYFAGRDRRPGSAASGPGPPLHGGARDRRRRHGPRVPGARTASAAPGGDQGHEPRSLHADLPRAVHPRSRGHLEAQPPQYRADPRGRRMPLRPGRTRRAVLLRDAVRRRGIAARSAAAG